MPVTLLLEMSASAFPDRVAVGAARGGLTFARLHESAAGGARLLREHGARHLVTVAVTGPLLPVGLFAAATAGVPLVPLNYRLAIGQLVELLGRIESPLVVADPAFADPLRKAGFSVVLTDEFLAAAAARGVGEPAPVDGDDAEVAVVLFTSGTTSAPKGVLLRHSHLLAYVMGTVDFGVAQDSDAALVSVPPYHIAGVGSALSNVYSGRRVVHLPDFTPSGWLTLVREEAVTSAMVVPTMLARIVDHLDGAPAGVPALRSLAYGGSRVARPVLEKALTLFPDTGFVNAYGLTETSSTLALLGPDDHRAALGSTDPAMQARLASVGRAVPGVEFQVRDVDDAPLPAGEVGDLYVRGEQVAGEYLGSGSALDPQGWFPTRDRASIDADGYLSIHGRSDDTIIRGGENIAPAEVEDVLVQHPDVAECAVVGLPDEEWGERLVAVVVPRCALDPQALRAFVRERARGSRTPDEVVLVAELPYTPTGKLLRRQLVHTLTAPVSTPAGGTS